MPSRLMVIFTTLTLSLMAAQPEASRAQATAQTAFERGLQLFAEATKLRAASLVAQDEVARRYREAAGAFIEAWKAGAATTAVFTNAANAHAFAGSLGEAVLFYKRALSVDPGNTRARNALEHVREKLPIKKPAAGAISSIRGSLFFWHDGLSFRLRSALGLMLYAAGFVCLTLALFRRKPFAFIGYVLLAPALALLSSVLLSAFTDSSRSEAVILVEAEGRLGNSSRIYSTSHSRPFPPGTEVSLLGAPRPGEGPEGAGDSWVNVRLLDGKESWVPSRTVEKVLP